jgi:hypothetical protein
MYPTKQFPTLFHTDTSSFIDLDGLRREAADFIARTPLVSRAARGERAAAVALHVGFWPFVREFEQAIDQHPLPREPLARNFGPGVVRRKLVELSKAVREMKEDEGSHAAHWAKDAQQIGLHSLEAPVLPAVEALVEASYTQELPDFFAMLAATEFVAEELSARLVASPEYTRLFDRARWMWGEIHLAHDHEGPSHLEIDVDLARAYLGNGPDAKERIESAIRRGIALFEQAALEVNEAIDGQLRAA